MMALTTNQKYAVEQHLKWTRGGLELWYALSDNAQSIIAYELREDIIKDIHDGGVGSVAAVSRIKKPEWYPDNRAKRGE